MAKQEPQSTTHPCFKPDETTNPKRPSQRSRRASIGSLRARLEVERGTSRMRFLIPILLAFLTACGADAGLRMTSGSDWHAFVRDQRGGPASADASSIRFRP